MGVALLRLHEIFVKLFASSLLDKRQASDQARDPRGPNDEEPSKYVCRALGPLIGPFRRRRDVTAAVPPRPAFSSFRTIVLHFRTDVRDAGSCASPPSRQTSSNTLMH